MARTPQLLDHRGQPIRKAELKREVSAATLGSVRSPISGYPGDGLDPIRLANILRSADRGDPVQYLELAEVIEERNPHYLGVLGTRRRSVSQIPVTVEPASDAAADVDRAAMIEKWLKRRELQLELFDILDAIGKGFSFTEIIWDTSSGQWQPERLEYRDPRWFRFDRRDLMTPVMLNEYGQEEPLPAFKFIFARMQAKSGLPLRSGIARVAMWAHLFKLYTERDWAIFTQTYGQPLRVGKWGAGASEADKDTLFQAVANIAGDCAAIIPESMQIDFVETGNLNASSDLYKDRADWLDQQISKAVLGQTATTDSVTGGLGSGKEHREVQEDIEEADCAALSAIITRDLARPWTMLEDGPGAASPTVIISRPEPEDIAALTSALGTLVPLGFRVSSAELYGKLGLTQPKAGDDILGQSAPKSPDEAGADGSAGDPVMRNSILKRFSGPFKRVEGFAGPAAPETHSSASAGRSAPFSPVDVMVDLLADQAAAEIEAMVRQIEAMLARAGSLEEFAEMVRAGYPELSAGMLDEMMARAMMAAHAGGRAQVADEDADG